MGIRKTLKNYALPYVRRMVAAVATVATRVALKAGEASLRLTIQEFENQRSQWSMEPVDSFQITRVTDLRAALGEASMSPSSEQSLTLIGGLTPDSLESSGVTTPHIGWLKASSSITALSTWCELMSLAGPSKDAN